MAFLWKSSDYLLNSVVVVVLRPLKSLENIAAVAEGVGDKCKSRADQRDFLTLADPWTLMARVVDLVALAGTPR